MLLLLLNVTCFTHHTAPKMGVSPQHEQAFDAFYALFRGTCKLTMRSTGTSKKMHRLPGHGHCSGKFDVLYVADMGQRCFWRPDKENFYEQKKDSVVCSDRPRDRSTARVENTTLPGAAVLEERHDGHGGDRCTPPSTNHPET